MTDKYILDGKTPQPCDDLMEWGEWHSNIDNRRVARDERGDVNVSTVFLGMDHQFGEGPPLLFETMVFGGKFDDECERYSTWDEAEAGHKAMCAKVFAGDEEAP